MTLSRRIERRETHSPRSGLAITLAVILIVALAYLATEIVLAALGQRALLASPRQMVQHLMRPSDGGTATLAVGGTVLTVVGIVLIVVAVSAGRRARHVERSDRAAIVIDNEVIASALVRTAADEAGVDPDRTVGRVSHRRATVRITPSSGLPIDRDAVHAAVRDRLDAWDLKPPLTPTIVIEKAGKVGA